MKFKIEPESNQTFNVEPKPEQLGFNEECKS